MVWGKRKKEKKVKNKVHTKGQGAIETNKGNVLKAGTDRGRSRLSRGLAFRMKEQVPKAQALQELPDDRTRPGSIEREREKKGGGEVPWCERCVGMTIFTKEMKERGMIPMCAGLRSRFPYDRAREEFIMGEEEQSGEIEFDCCVGTSYQTGMHRTLMIRNSIFNGHDYRMFSSCEILF